MDGVLFYIDEFYWQFGNKSFFTLYWFKKKLKVFILLGDFNAI